MRATRTVSIESLSLDLNNFRTVKQASETKSVHAMVAVNPEWFFALMESLLDDGYLPTENIIALKAGKKLIVKEGNRRVGALKIALGQMRGETLRLPVHITDKIAKLSDSWKSENSTVPCAIYDETEAEVVDKIVALTHGKGERAGRDNWNAVARARHNRDKSNSSEPALDLLERYLKDGKNVTPDQCERWAGDYPLTILGEAMKRIAPRVGASSAGDLAAAYPDKVKHRDSIEQIILDIGHKRISFEAIRDKGADFGQGYGLPPATAGRSQASSAGKPRQKSRPAKNKQSAAYALNDPRAVYHALKEFKPSGRNRNKLVTLVEEAKLLKLNRHPHAFCFLLRSMFEISAKAYCEDHKSSGGPKATRSDGEDRKLVELLREITAHLTNNSTDKQMKRVLHGAIADLGRSDSILSVTSMNQLIHNPRFSIDQTHICGVFNNIFPLLEEMNR